MFLIDTNVLSELRKRHRANPLVVDWFRKRESEELFLSVLTLGELRRGIERVRTRDPASAAALEVWLGRTTGEFVNRIIGIDQAIAERWGRIGTRDPISAVDALIAATALEQNLVVVTRNVKDIARTGARHVDPFSTDAD